MAWHWLFHGLIILLSLSYSLAGASHKKITKLQEDGILEEQEIKNYCPEFCTCVRKNGDGLIAKCEKITAVQQFDDRYSDFKLFHDSKNSGEAITLDDRFFLHLQLKSIQSISVVDFPIKAIDLNAFKGLHDLALVNLTNNGLKKIHPDSFAGNRNLKLLSLSGNQLEFEDTFSLNTPYLQELDFSSCQLSTLTSKLLSKLSLLTYLNLESNYLDAIDSSVFLNLTALEEINLSNNKIHSLNWDLFIYNEALEHLILRGNPLTTVENTHLPRLSNLDLSFCRFEQLSSNSFNCTQGVTNLNLSNNVIEEIRFDAFAKLANLAHLDLSSNSLNKPLDDNLFIMNNKLETLSLKDNPNMKLLPPTGFNGSFDELFKLNVANCGIETLSASSLKNLENLSQLDLSQNALQSLEDDRVFPIGLTHLNLAFNKITDLNRINFPEKFHLRKLSLAGNEIEHLTTKFFSNLQFLTSLDVSKCEMEQIWQNQLDDRYTLSSLSTINFSENKLQKISRRDLEVFNNLKLLNVMKNPLSCGDGLNALQDYLLEAHISQFKTQSDDTIRQDLAFSLNCLKNGHVQATATHLSYNVHGEDKDSDETDSEIDEADDDYYSDSFEDNEVEGGEIITASDPHLETATSYQLVVMLLAALATFVVIVGLLVSLIVCRYHLLLHRENLAKRAGTGHTLNVYKPLFDNEHFNSPTTPIMKTREISMGPETREFSTVAV